LHKEEIVVIVVKSLITDAFVVKKRSFIEIVEDGNESIFTRTSLGWKSSLPFFQNSSVLLTIMSFVQLAFLF
jgi:hypothetical protein